MVAALVLKDITHVYDFSNTTPGTDHYAYKGAVGARPPPTSDNEVTLTGKVTSSIGNYIVSGNVIVLVVQNSAADGSNCSHAETNYVKRVIDPKVG